MKYHYYFFDLLPYFILGIMFIILLLSKVLKEEKKSTIIFMILMLFVGLRYDVGWDYYMYEDQIIYGYTERYEFLSKLIFDFSHYINFYPLAFILFGFFTLYLTKLTIDKYSQNKTLSWVIVYGLPFLFMASLSTIRQSLATAIIFYSISSVLKKQYLQFLMHVLIASLFHSSAIIGVLLYPLFHVKIKKSILFFLFILSILIDTLLGDFLKNNLLQIFKTANSLSYYLENPNEQYQMIKLKILLNIICFITFILYDRIAKKNELNRKFLTISMFGVIFFNSFIFEPNTAYRVGAFFMQFWVLLIPDFVFKVNEKLKVREISIAVFFLVFHWVMIQLLISAYNNNILEKIGVLPYKFWFNHL